MSKYNFLLLFFLLGAGCVPKKSIGTLSICNIELYTSLGDTGAKFKNQLSTDGVKNVLFVNGGHYIDPDFDGIVNKDVLETFLYKYGNPNDSTVVVLNWEGKPFKCLHKCDVNSSEFKNALREYIRGYQIVKKILPKSLVGYYALPFREYWARDDKWRKSNERIFPLLKELDVLYPSLYDFYEDTLPFNLKGKKDLEYIHDNTTEAIKVGLKLNKPVMPFIWHRMHDSNKRLKRTLIEPNEFYRHIKGIVDCEINGKKIDGLVWWSSEDYFYRIKEAEYKQKKPIDFVEHQYTTGNTYLDLIKEALAQNCRR